MAVERHVGLVHRAGILAVNFGIQHAVGHGVGLIVTCIVGFGILSRNGLAVYISSVVVPRFGIHRRHVEFLVELLEGGVLVLESLGEFFKGLGVPAFYQAKASETPLIGIVIAFMVLVRLLEACPAYLVNVLNMCYHLHRERQPRGPFFACFFVF